MKQKDLRFFERILRVQSRHGNCGPMVDLLLDIGMEEGYDTSVDRGNVYMVKRTDDGIPVGLVAHMDTVHNDAKEFDIMHNGDWIIGWDNATGKQHGIGGDDRCGIFMALMVARQIPNARLFFPRDEEIGCVGSGLMLDGWLDPCAFIMQADRKGWGEITETVSGTPMMSKRFKKALKPAMEEYGFKFCHGMMTDVGEIKDNGAKVCAFNMSASYYYPHYDDEAIYVHGVTAGIRLMVELAIALSYKRWMHTAPKRQRYATYGTGSPLQKCLGCNNKTIAKDRICWECGKGKTNDERDHLAITLTNKEFQEKATQSSLLPLDPCPWCRTYAPLYDIGQGVQVCADCVNQQWASEGLRERCDFCGEYAELSCNYQGMMICDSCDYIWSDMADIPRRTKPATEPVVRDVVEDR